MLKYKTVEEFLDDQSPSKKAQVEALRQLILKTDSSLTEHIKWNAPSYVLGGEDRVTFNVLNKEDVVKLVLHMGATRKEEKHGKPILNDPTGLIVWSSDIRGMLSFKNLEGINAKREQVAQILEKWLTLRS